MVQILELNQLEYTEALLDSPEFRDKLDKHEKHIIQTNKEIKILLNKCEDVIQASDTLRLAQESFSKCLKDFKIGFVGKLNEEEKDIVDTLNSTCFLIDDIKEYTNKLIKTGHTLFGQIEEFRKRKYEIFKEKKKEYEKQTNKYCLALEKYLGLSSKKIEENEFKDYDSLVKDENQIFYKKCLDYVNNIQEFEDEWFRYFAESMCMFVNSWTTFYHEGYEKHVEYEPCFRKSQSGIQKLRDHYELINSQSKDLVQLLLQKPDSFISTYQSVSNDSNKLTSKQGYLFLLEKKTIGPSTWTKQFCKYYKEEKLLEITPYSQINKKQYQLESYLVISCLKCTNDKLDKRFIFEVQTNDKLTLTFQSLSIDDFKSWFSIMEGQDINSTIAISSASLISSNNTTTTSSYSKKNDMIYNLDSNGILFIKKCIYLLEDDNRIVEEGIYRKNGVSHKIQTFIDKYYLNCSNGTSDDLFTNISLKTASNSNSSLNSSTNSIKSPQTPSSTTNNHESLVSSLSTLDDTCTITSALKHYLSHLKEPLMTFALNSQFLQAYNIGSLRKRVIEIHKLLSQLPTNNFLALQLVMTHLFNVSQFSKFNKMTTSNLATCFSPTVFRTEQESVSNLYNMKFYSEIIDLLIINNDKIFLKHLDDAYLDSLDSQQIQSSQLNIKLRSIQNNSESTRSSENRKGLYVKSTLQKVPLQNDEINKSTSSESSHSDRENQYQLKSPQISNQLTNELLSQTPKNQLQIIPSYSTKFGTPSSSSSNSKSSSCSLNSRPNIILNGQQSLTQSKHKPARNNPGQSSDRPRRACTLFVCQADNPSELSFEANVILTDVKRSKEAGWYEGTYQGKTGLVPGNYIQFLDD